MKLITYIGVARYAIWCDSSSNIVPDPWSKLFLACSVCVLIEKKGVCRSISYSASDRRLIIPARKRAQHPIPGLPRSQQPSSTDASSIPAIQVETFHPRGSIIAMHLMWAIRSLLAAVSQYATLNVVAVDVDRLFDAVASHAEVSMSVGALFGACDIFSRVSELDNPLDESGQSYSSLLSAVIMHHPHNKPSCSS